MTFSLSDVFHLSFFLVIAFLTVEVFLWSRVLNRHARWMHNVQTQHKEKRLCFVDGWFSVFIASVMACGLSLIAFFWECYIVRAAWMGVLPHSTYAPWIISGLQISHIHFFVLIAKCVCIDRTDWPSGSCLISKMLNRVGVVSLGT